MKHYKLNFLITLLVVVAISCKLYPFDYYIDKKFIINNFKVNEDFELMNRKEFNRYRLYSYLRKNLVEAENLKITFFMGRVPVSQLEVSGESKHGCIIVEKSLKEKTLFLKSIANGWIAVYQYIDNSWLAADLKELKKGSYLVPIKTQSDLTKVCISQGVLVRDILTFNDLTIINRVDKNLNILSLFRGKFYSNNLTILNNPSDQSKFQIISDDSNIKNYQIKSNIKIAKDSKYIFMDVNLKYPTMVSLGVNNDTPQLRNCNPGANRLIFTTNQMGKADITIDFKINSEIDQNQWDFDNPSLSINEIYTR